MAPSYIATIAALLAQVLKLLGIEVGDEQLTNAIVTVITIGAGLVVVFRQLTEGRSNLFGVKPK